MGGPILFLIPISHILIHGPAQYISQLSCLSVWLSGLLVFMSLGGSAYPEEHRDCSAAGVVIERPFGFSISSIYLSLGVLICPATTAAAAISTMWRSSITSSSKKLFPPSFSSSAYPRADEVIRPLLSCFQFLSTASPSSSIPTSQPPTSALDPLKLGLGLGGKSDGVRAFASSSATAFDLSSLTSSKARDAVDLARHYGRCYWELSKARLRQFISRLQMDKLFGLLRVG
ncbi:hypothetical protein CRG98_029168 [Punica granatum]|uniref:Uncharacterized protein n=1 Tax=Punica granatum TaxID=22663 RepID=A0A2I0J2F0_PUNGR|nr:hypothetical protein CRG98_029168 [Punica granatum]